VSVADEFDYRKMKDVLYLLSWSYFKTINIADIVYRTLNIIIMLKQELWIEVVQIMRYYLCFQIGLCGFIIKSEL
jgi:hypothetical protein